MTTAMDTTTLSTQLGDLTYQMLVAGANESARIQLTMPQLKVLLLLGAERNVPVSSIAQRMSVSPPNVTGILDRLEVRGYIQRQQDRRDRRVVRIVLTEEGERMLHEFAAAGAASLSGTIDRLTTSDRHALSQGIAALQRALSTESGA